MAKRPYIANAVFRIVQMMVNKDTFVGFRGGGAIVPLDPPCLRVGPAHNNETSGLR